MGKKKRIRSLIAIVLSISMILSSFAFPQGNEGRAKAAINTLSKTFTGDGFTVSYDISSQWGSAYIANVTIKNMGTSPLRNWSLKFYLDDTITNIWNASIAGNEGNIYTIQNPGWNKDIAVGGSVSFGFVASVNGDITVPSSFYLPSFTTQLEQVPASDYNVEFLIDSDWTYGFTGRFNISNLTNQPINDWTLEFDFDKNINSIWNAAMNDHTGNHYTIMNKTYNSSIPSGSAISLGFIGSKGNVTNKPSNYKLWRKSEVSTITSSDIDGDGIGNNTELIQGTNPYSKDTDSVPPSIPTELAVTEQSSTAIAISWKAATDNQGVTGYDVFINNVLAGTVGTTAYRVENLTPGTTYQFTVVAKDSAGNLSASSAALEVTTEKGNDTKVLSAPTGLSAVVISGSAISIVSGGTITVASGSAISLSWNASIDNEGITAYEIYCNHKLVDTVSATSYIYTEAMAGEAYQFYIVAKDAAGNASAPSEAVSAQLEGQPGDHSGDNPEDHEAPVLSSDGIKATSQASSVSLSWSPASDNVMVTGYRIYRDNQAYATTEGTSYTDHQVTLGQTYSYSISAYDAIGNESPESSPVTITPLDNSAPTAPTNLICTQRSSFSLAVQWNASTDDTKVAGYDIFANSKKVGSTTQGTEYSLTGLRPNTDYAITIKAMDEVGNSSLDSEVLSVTTLPAAVMNLAAEYGEAGVTVSWDAVDGAEGYQLKINEQIITVNGGTTYLQSQVLPMTQYHYQVCAVNGNEVGEWSEATQIFTPPAKVEGLKAKVIDNSDINLQWSAVDQALAYEIEINGTIVTTTDATTYLHKNINTIEANNYRVRAVNGEKKGLWSDSVLKANCVVVSGGAITSDTEWDKSNGYYLVQGDVTVDQAATLTVKAGTIIKFAPRVGMTVDGTFKTLGEESYPIIITSELDPAYGGSGINSYADCWRGISISNTGSYSAEYTSILHAGYYDAEDEDAIVGYAVLAKGMLSMDHCTVSRSAQQGIRIEAEQNVSIQNSVIEASQFDNIAVVKKTDTGVLSLRNNIIRNSEGCGLGIYALGDSDFTADNNQFTGNKEVPIQIDLTGIRSSVAISGILENSYTEQGMFNDIYLYGTLAADITLNEGRYVFGTINVPTERTLRILPGTTMLGHAGGGSITVEGKFIAEANSEKKIVFSSTSDPEYGGKGITEANDYWIGIDVKETGEFRGDNIIIRYAGLGIIPAEQVACSISDNLTISDFHSSLLAEGRVYLINSLINYSYTNGILIIPGQDVTIRNNTITDSLGENISIDTYGTEHSIGEDTVHGIITIRENILKNAVRNGLLLYNPGNCTLVIEENQILNNAEYPVSVRLDEVKESYIISELWNNTFEGNQASNHIYLEGDIKHDLVIPAEVYNVGYFYISSATLTVPAGTVFIMGGYIDDKGKLVIKGTSDKPVIFTDMNDPEYGGNGFTDDSRQWSGIDVETEAVQADHLVLKHANVGFNVDHGLISLTNSKIMNCNYGIILNNYDIDDVLWTSDMVIKHNSFIDNTRAVYIDSDYGGKIDLSQNYWNSVYGPEFGIAKVEDPSESFSTIIFPELHGPGEKVIVFNREGINNVDLILSPYLGSELAYCSQFSKTDGVNKATGNYSKQFTDMSVNSLGDTVEFTRNYNSQDQSEGILGKGWTFGFEGSISDCKDMPGTKLVILPSGNQESFTLNADGSYSSSFSRSTLKKNADGSYIVKKPEKISYGFQADGALIWIENQDKNRLTITLDQDNKPIALKDYSKRNYTFQYTGKLLTNITDSKGRTVEYIYENGQLVKVVDSKKNTTYYTYSPEGLLSEIRDGNKDLLESISYVADPTGLKVAQVTDTYGNQQNYVYDKAAGMTTTTDSDGNKITEWYDGTYHTSKVTDAEGNTIHTNYFYDDGVNKYSEISSETDKNGNVTSYERDADGNTTKCLNPDGTYQLFTYDTNRNLTSEQDENGNLTYYLYDETGTYLLKEIRPLNGMDRYTEGVDQSKFAITTYTYYEEGVYGFKGLKKSVTDPNGNTTTYTYNAEGNLITETDALDNQTVYTYDEKGNVTEILSPKKEKTKNNYDSNGRLVSTVLTGGETTQYRYDSLGRVIQKITPNIYKPTQSEDDGYRYTYYSSGAIHTKTDPLGNVTTYTYDLHGNLKSETRPNGSIYSYKYDSMDRIKAEYVQEDANQEKTLLRSYTYTILDDHKTQTTETVYLNDTETAVTTSTYDYAGRLVNQTNPDGGANTTVYNGNGTVYSETDALGKTTYYKYDGLNRLTEQWIPHHENTYTYTSVTYDKNGNKIAESVGVESVSLWGKSTTLLTTTYEYDANNQVKVTTSPTGGTSTYTYDANGNVSRETVSIDDKKNKVTEYTYNYLNKPVTVTQYTDAEDIYGSNTTGEIGLITTYTYDADGNVSTVIAPDGNLTTYEYDLLDRQITQTTDGLDENGDKIKLITSNTYDYAGNILTTTNANGNTTTNLYDGRGRLVKKTDAEGGVTASYYDNAGRLIATVPPNSYTEGAELTSMNRAVFTYDTMGRVILEQDIYADQNGDWRTINAKAYQYDLNGNVIKELDALGYDSGTGSTIAEKISSGYGTTKTYNDAGQLLTVQTPVTEERGKSFDTSSTYDGAGRKVTETNVNGVVTTLIYDEGSRVTKTTVQDKDGSAEKTVAQATYDYLGNVLTQTDGNGNKTTYTYNRLGLVKSKTTPGDASILANTIAYQYDRMGRQADQQDSLGKEIIATYDHNGKLLTQTEQKKDGTQSITVSNSYDKNGNKRFVTDANGTTMEYRYDKVNRVSSASVKVSGVEHTTTYTYDKNGNQLTTTDWLGNTYTSTYDALNRLMKKTDPYKNIIERYEYNDNHAQVKAYDAKGNATTFTYDKNNRLLVTTDQEKNTASQTYDDAGNIATKADGKGNTTTYNYNAFHQLTSVTNAKDEVTTYTYDLNGNVLTQKDGKGNTTGYTYNAANLLLTQTDAASGVVSYTYYANGSRKTVTDRNGNTTTYTYDIHGKLMSEKTGSWECTYTYDKNGNQLTITNSTGTTTRTYDELGRVLTKKAPKIGTMTYAHDLTEGVEEGCYQEKSTAPDKKVTTKIYDRTGRLISVSADGNEATYTYDANGNRESVSYSNGTKEAYTYYANNQVKTLVNKAKDGSILDRYSYTYDKAGNQLSKSEFIGGVEKGTTSYTYDELNRLSTVTEPSGKTTAYEYDKAGNRAKVTTTVTNPTSGATVTLVDNYTYDTRNRLTELATKVNNVLTKSTGYTYDNNGNQLTTVVKTYTNGTTITSTVNTMTNTYDVKNQLIKSITDDGTTINNTYNGEGYRVGKELIAKDGSKKQTYYFYEADKVVLEADENGNLKARNIYGTSLLMRSTGDKTYYYLYNGHADVTSLTKEDGSIAATYYYDAFGNILEQTGEVDNSICYAGYQYDEETGLYYLNARMYDPVTASFIQEDTYQGVRNDPLSLNLYTYCQGNPIKYIDPTGHKSINDYENDGSNLKYWFDDSNFPVYWWQDEKKLNKAVSMLKKEIKETGPISLLKFNTKDTKYIGNTGEKRMLAIQALANAERTGYYDGQILTAIENNLLVEGIDFNESNFSLDIKSIEALERRHKKIKLKKSGDCLERGLGLVIEGATVLAAGIAESRAYYPEDIVTNKYINVVEDDATKVASNTGKLKMNLQFFSNKGASNSVVSSEMENKILYGQRTNGNTLIGGHSPKITNSNPNYAVEEIAINADGTKVVKFTTQFENGNLSKIKKSTLFPDSWSNNKIINEIKSVGDSPSLGVRASDNATIHRGVVDGVQVEVIKIGDNVVSAYPTGGGASALPGGFK